MKELLNMLKYRRPAGSATELEYIQRFIEPTGAEPDGYGNYHLTIGDNPITLFSSHTDTVHNQAGMQRIKYDTKTDTVRAVKSNCLGADDGTGNWLMLQMIRAEIDGLYIFHREEETGGGGSQYIANSTPSKLDGIVRAIAFDRMGKKDVIYSQMGRCCSTEFADKFASMLGKEWSKANGIFTDTANYIDLIPECTNISVGYENQHSKRETQCVGFAEQLRDKILSFQWDELPTSRDPKEKDDYDIYGYGGYDFDSYGYGSNYRSNRRYGHNTIYESPKLPTQVLPANCGGSVDHYWLKQAVSDASTETLASILEDMGVSAEYVYRYGDMDAHEYKND